MNIYAGLLFNQGHLQEPELARSLAGASLREAEPDAEPDAAAAKPAPSGNPASATPAARSHHGWAEVGDAVLSAFR